MKKVLKNITSNWFVFLGYLSLFLLTVIAALQIYDANYKITGKYKELAYRDNRKLALLLRFREDFEQFQAITIDRVFHPSEMTPAKQSRLDQLVIDIGDHLARY